MRYLALILMLASLSARGDGLVHAPDASHYGRFDTVLDAVLAATNAHNPDSIEKDTEYMGAIVKDLVSGEHAYTVSMGTRGADSITIRVRVPRGHRIVAFWHTHGAKEDFRTIFSDTDTALADSRGVPLYLADHTGLLKVYRPFDRKLSMRERRRLGGSISRGFSKAG